MSSPKRTKQPIKSDFYNKYGFNIGDTILILPENDGRSLYNFSEEEMVDLTNRAEKGIIKSASGRYGTIGSDGIKGPFYETIHIETTDGRLINCNPIYYRLYGRFDSLGLNTKPIFKRNKLKALYKRK
jgi:hypothetical protein